MTLFHIYLLKLFCYIPCHCINDKPRNVLLALENSSTYWWVPLDVWCDICSFRSSSKGQHKHQMQPYHWSASILAKTMFLNVKPGSIILFDAGSPCKQKADDLGRNWVRGGLDKLGQPFNPHFGSVLVIWGGKMDFLSIFSKHNPTKWTKEINMVKFGCQMSDFARQRMERRWSKS